jgi:hypothetical protein
MERLLNEAKLGRHLVVVGRLGTSHYDDAVVGTKVEHSAQVTINKRDVAFL